MDACDRPASEVTVSHCVGPQGVIITLVWWETHLCVDVLQHIMTVYHSPFYITHSKWTCIFHCKGLSPPKKNIRFSLSEGYPACFAWFMSLIWLEYRWGKKLNVAAPPHKNIVFTTAPEIEKSLLVLWFLILFQF